MRKFLTSSQVFRYLCLVSLASTAALPCRAETAPACPSQQFPVFLKKFANDLTLQRQFTLDPLRYGELIDGEPEPVMQEKSVAHRALHFPTLPLEQQRREQKLTLKITQLSAKQAIVELSKPDTDYQVEYIFHKRHCWILDQQKNWSL